MSSDEELIIEAKRSKQYRYSVGCQTSSNAHNILNHQFNPAQAFSHEADNMTNIRTSKGVIFGHCAGIVL